MPPYGLHDRYTESLTMLQLLLSQSADIQKILAFEGAFEKLFNIVTQEGGVDGGVSVRDALACVDTLLRFNPSNQVAPLIHMPRREHRPQYISRVTSVKRRFHQSCRHSRSRSLPSYPPSHWRL